MVAICFAIFLFSLTYIQKIDYKNLTSVKDNYSKLISLPDKHFVDLDKYSFIMQYKILTKNDKIIDFVDHTSDLLNSINKKKFYLSSFGETLDGELLLIDYSGSIYQLQYKN